MPRNISFFLTTPQFVDGTKTVTRRNGWRDLKPGDVLCAVEKGQGLGKGGKVKRLGMVRVVSARTEKLRALTDNLGYGVAETTREGFPKGHPKHDPATFVEFFCKTHKGVTPETDLVRIEFEKLPSGGVL